MAIIAISGKIGSGKDTVGKIIQYLDAKSKNEKEKEIAPKLFLPDVEYPTLEEWCKSRLHESGYDIGHLSMYEIHSNSWQIKKFAEKLKQIAGILTDIHVEKFEDQEFKKTEMDDVWAINGMPITIRQFLQRLGTEAIRDNLHSNAWVNALFADYKEAELGTLTINPNTWDEHNVKQTGSYPKWIITDMRFPNEYEAVKARKGITIRVIRDYVLSGGPEDPKNLHPSETALDNQTFDYEIVNNDTIEELISSVRSILQQNNII